VLSTVGCWVIYNGCDLPGLSRPAERGDDGSTLRKPKGLSS
jgi:hypothetical protein